MRRIILLVFLPVLLGLPAAAQVCQPESITLYRNQELHLRLLFHEVPSKSATVELRSEDMPARSMRTDKDGTVDFGVLSPGAYSIQVRRWGRMNLLVRPEQGANGPWITWSALEKSRAKKVGTNCVVIEVSD